MALVGTTKGEWLARGVFRQEWTSFNALGAGQAMDGAMLPDKSVHVQGTWGTGTTTLVIQGSNTATSITSTGGTWFTLNDPQGNALSFATGKIEQILENTKYVRPRLTAKSATTDLTVAIVAQSVKR